MDTRDTLLLPIFVNKGSMFNMIDLIEKNFLQGAQFQARPARKELVCFQAVIVLLHKVEEPKKCPTPERRSQNFTRKRAQEERRKEEIRGEKQRTGFCDLPYYRFAEFQKQMQARHLLKSNTQKDQNTDLLIGRLSSVTNPLSELPSHPMKIEFSDSPNSPLSNNVLDCDRFSALHNSQEQQSSTEAQSAGRSHPRSPLNSAGGTILSTTRALSFLHQQNPVSRVPIASPNQTQNHALRELENMLMAPDTETEEAAAATTSTSTGVRPRSWEDHDGSHQNASIKYQKFIHGSRPERRRLVQVKEEPQLAQPQVDVKRLLMACAEAISVNKMVEFEALVERTRCCVSVSGDPIQRLGAYMLEGLVARQEASGDAIYRSLRCKEEPRDSELMSHMRVLYDFCPYFKFGYMAANGAIAEAVRNEDRVHIIDFQIAQGSQWLTLIQALAARPGGPPHVRITGIDDPFSRYARGGEGLRPVGRRLAAISERFNIPLEFNEVPVSAADEVTREMLDIRPGEALAVNFTLQLHHTPDESVDVRNPRDGLLRMVKGLSPKVTTLVEQESNSNTAPFLTRFAEALEYYRAVFESLDEALPRGDRGRIGAEQHCLAKDIVNVVACEGRERVERYELLGKWRSRLGMAGFRPSPLSGYVNSVIRSLIKCYSDKYTLVEKDGALLLGWRNRNLISASAWH